MMGSNTKLVVFFFRFLPKQKFLCCLCFLSQECSTSTHLIMLRDSTVLGWAKKCSCQLQMNLPRSNHPKSRHPHHCGSTREINRKERKKMFLIFHLVKKIYNRSSSSYNSKLLAGLHLLVNERANNCWLKRKKSIRIYNMNTKIARLRNPRSVNQHNTRLLILCAFLYY